MTKGTNPVERERERERGDLREFGDWIL